MPCSATAAELRHDIDGVDVRPYLGEALEELISGVLAGQEVRGVHQRIDLSAALWLLREEECHELLMRAVEAHKETRAALEKLLRDRFEGSHITADIAHRIANEQDE